ncbi:helix-turn-helix domain-containing protein [Oxalobacter aliiformigenes]|uniref:Helix-turn-helix domain-containing protein n=1 Tax=Oxalobacter aliiformigenes TaxID=2946593 RepID=A0ABY7JGG0_9BURK|nr:helix-turn-helix domain-containing protein [Oxalobacter aliiformigenes]WAV88897.1 helix-turn-helix domain-containing protein [Oxalobacter aliiformigenes]WAV92993.1 helix-turn-helix domain-containing protein [Oxalobacter aliiformigenes]WAV95504.1 helix-turn-helix domain-containing protein [Oxalobacter aliiformigenes]WAV96700.1 helix-turn-helix domain-containing protein [Oxalobacter aliiformigenes]
MNTENDKTTGKLLFSVKEFCEMVGIGRTTFYQEVKAGRIKAKKMGRSTLIPKSELERFIEELPSF